MLGIKKPGVSGLEGLRAISAAEMSEEPSILRQA
jgi:hypothetical protein